MWGRSGFRSRRKSFFDFFFFQAEDGIRDRNVTEVQTCALPICGPVRLTDGPRPDAGLVAVGHPEGSVREVRGGPGGCLGVVEDEEDEGLGLESEAGDVLEEIGRASCRERG